MKNKSPERLKRSSSILAAWVAIPYTIISFIFFVVSLITFFVNKSKVKNLQ